VAGKGGKRARPAETPGQTRLTVRPPAGDTPPDGKPVFRIGHIDFPYQGSWSWRAADEKVLTSVRAFLHEKERKTWSEVFREVRNDGKTAKSATGHHKHKPIPVTEICREAQQRLTDLGHDDVDTLFEWSLTAEARIWSFFRDQCCYLLWLDLNHKVLPVSKSHT
jgi:hypothetical protein